MSAQTPLTGLADRRILLGVTGSIAAYKAPIILRQLVHAGAHVKVILTDSAQRFVGEQTFSGFGAEVYQSMWDAGGELHVSLAHWAELILVAPATADTLARFACGRCDDLLLATLLCADRPVCVAPAMHPTMWNAPATRLNAQRLFERGVHFLGPVEGEVASGETGLGRMQEPSAIAYGLARLLQSSRVLGGRRVVITAGPTVEALDPVRSLSNASSGKMGYALAEVALDLGADVTLVSGPVSLTPPAGAHLISVRSALEMQDALWQCVGPNLSEADAVIMTAAVSDYRPESTSQDKLKRKSDSLTLRLVANPDIIAQLGQRRSTLRPVLVAFALETAEGDALVSLGRSKLIDKRVDLVVANRASESLGSDNAQVLLVSPVDCISLDQMTKPQIARHILGWVAQRLEGPEIPEQTQ